MEPTFKGRFMEVVGLGSYGNNVIMVLYGQSFGSQINCSVDEEWSICRARQLERLAYVYVYVYVYMCVYIYIYMYTYTYMSQFHENGPIDVH